MQLRKQGVSVVVHDPWVTDYRGDVLEMAQGCDAVVVMVGHDAYRQLSLSSLAAALRNPLLIDGRRVFDRKEAQGAGFDYWGVGQGVSRS